MFFISILYHFFLFDDKKAALTLSRKVECECGKLGGKEKKKREKEKKSRL
jgi:hypothetical protein